MATTPVSASLKWDVLWQSAKVTFWLIKTGRGETYAQLDGKIALITGGTSGIGLATAKQFVNEGAYVFITGRRDQELAAAVKEIGRKASGVQGDVSNLADLDRLFAQIRKEKGKIDVVFANAGVAKYALFGKITEELILFDTTSASWLRTGTFVVRLFVVGESQLLRSQLGA
jgi:NAD(P)-dependent dehydrogenase (short-subunit alcohol dehydrogenase family)